MLIRSFLLQLSWQASETRRSWRRPSHRLTFVLTLGSKERFGRSRDVGCILAYDLVEVSSETMILSLASPMPATPISEVWSSSAPTTSFDRIDETRRCDSGGLHLAARGGKQAKSKAVVAVARKLADLLHHLRSTQEPYMPFYEQAA